MSVFRKAFFAILTILYFVVPASAQSKKKQRRPDVDIAAARSRWVDSIYTGLSEEERIGQLFMVAAYSGGKNYNEEQVTTLLNAHQVGGLIFMQGGAGRQAGARWCGRGLGGACVN